MGAGSAIHPGTCALKRRAWLRARQARQTGCAGGAPGAWRQSSLSAAYALSPQTELRLNVNNLFDRHYYQSIGWTHGGNVFGALRNVLAMLQHRF